jgi:predicted transcriptional regulator
MAILDITLRGITAKSTICIRVKLQDESGGVEETRTRRLKPSTRLAGRGQAAETSHKQEARDVTRRDEPLRAGSRLRPTDKLVFNFLYARVRQGETETQPIKVRELMEACLISRRQVGICLRRLNEKGMISRVVEETLSRSQEGYRYRLLALPSD